ncbi:MAG: NUDIX domain-containing protein [Nitrospiraceae bacterium]|nr:MAG: NUDIX domain-containing protein [Nitrospiraceae bacterium]
MYGNTLIDPQTTVKAGVGVIILDDEQRILLERRSDNGLWGLSGGAIDPGETILNAAIREVKEETNLVIKIIGIIGIYSDPADGRIVTYPDNGDVRHLVDVIFTAEIISGEMKKSHESIELRFFNPDSLPSEIAPPALRPLKDYAAGKKFVIR